jgi:transposase
VANKKGETYLQFSSQGKQQRIIVTGCTKLCRKMHKNRPHLLGDGPLILQDNARPHLQKVVTYLLIKYEWEVLPHAPYSPDMSPPDFDLFHKLKEPMRGHRFPSLEEVPAAVTRAIRGLNKSGTLNGIAIFRNVRTRSLRSRGTTQKDCKEILPKIKHTCQ